MLRVIGVIASTARGLKRVSSNRRDHVCIGGSDVMGGAVSSFGRVSPGPRPVVITPTSRDEK